MGCDEPADLIGSCEASLDALGLLMGDIKEKVQDSGDSWTIAQILNHLPGVPAPWLRGAELSSDSSGACGGCAWSATRG